MSFVSFRMHVPVEPNEQERQKSKIFLSLYPVPFVLEGRVLGQRGDHTAFASPLACAPLSPLLLADTRSLFVRCQFTDKIAGHRNQLRMLA